MSEELAPGDVFVGKLHDAKTEKPPSTELVLILNPGNDWDVAGWDKEAGWINKFTGTSFPDVVAWAHFPTAKDTVSVSEIPCCCSCELQGVEFTHCNHPDWPEEIYYFDWWASSSDDETHPYCPLRAKPHLIELAEAKKSPSGGSGA